MSLYVTIFVCLLANFIISYHGYEAKPASLKSQSIASIIINDKDICNSTRDVVEQSKYLQECGKINFPDKFINVTSANLNESLCIALYDRFRKIDHYDNCTEAKKTGNMTVLNNHVLFDGVIAASNIKAKDSIPGVVCRRLSNISSPAFDNIEKSVTLLKSAFASHRHCLDMCVSETDDINPLCIALGIVDEQLETKVEHSNDTKKDVSPPSSAGLNSQKTNDPKTVNAGMNDPEDSISRPKESMQVDHTSAVEDDPSAVKTPKSVSKVVDNAGKIASDNIGSNANPAIEKKSESPKPNAPSQIDQIAQTGQNPPPIDESAILKDTEEAANIEKSTTLSEKTRNEEQSDPSVEYNGEMTGDNDQVAELENGDAMDDIQSEIPKQIQPMDDNLIDQKEKIPRLSSMHKEDDSHFYGYVTIIGLIGISACLIYHHKQKILAMIVEGRRSRGGRGRKRPSTANYRKLDCNLEEAVTSQCNANVTHVIY